MRTGLTVSAIVHVAVVAWTVVTIAVSPHKASSNEPLMPVNVDLGIRFHENDGWPENRSPGRHPKPLVEQVAEQKPVEDRPRKSPRRKSRPPARRRPSRRRNRSRSSSRPRSRPTRSPRRSRRSRSGPSRSRPPRLQCRRASPPHQRRNTIPNRSKRCSTNAIQLACGGRRHRNNMPSLGLAKARRRSCRKASSMRSERESKSAGRHRPV